jgi:MFS family permease
MREISNFKRDLTILILILLLGAALRLDFLVHSALDADEAIVGLMAKHMAEGASPPIFYYGQHYMGSFESLFVGILFNLFGISTFALKIVPFAFSMLLIPLVYFIGATIGGRLAGQLSALVMAAAPASLILWSSKARGGFAELIFLGGLAAFFAPKWFSSENPRKSLTFVIWFILGLGWWVNNQIIFFICPIALLGALHLIACKRSQRYDAPSILAHAGVALMAFFIGGLPFWIYNLEYNFISFEMFQRAQSGDVAKHFYGLFSEALPMIFGAHRFWTEEPIFPGATHLAYVLYGVPVIWALFYLLPTDAKRHIERVWTLRLMVLLFLTTLSIFAISSFGHLTQAPRYLLPLYVPLMILVGTFAAAVYRTLPILAYLWVSLTLVLNMSSAYLGERAVDGEPYVFDGQRVSKDHTELIKWLNDNTIGHVRTNYWIGYRLAFESKESVKFVVFREPNQVRIPWYEKVDNIDLLPLVLVPKQGVIIENALRVLGVKHKKITLSGYTVLYDLEPEPQWGPIIAPEKLTVVASENNAESRNVIDGNNNTRWGSSKPQSMDMTLKIKPLYPMPFQTLTYDLGLWPHDFPRALEVSIVLPNGTKQKILTAKDYADLRYYLTDPRVFRFSIPPTKISELELSLAGEDSTFDWTVAELGIYPGTVAPLPITSSPIAAAPFQPKKQIASDTKTLGLSGEPNVKK